MAATRTATRTRCNLHGEHVAATGRLGTATGLIGPAALIRRRDILADLPDR